MQCLRTLNSSLLVCIQTTTLSNTSYCHLCKILQIEFCTKEASSLHFFASSSWNICPCHDSLIHAITTNNFHVYYFFLSPETYWIMGFCNWCFFFFNLFFCLIDSALLMWPCYCLKFVPWHLSFILTSMRTFPPLQTLNDMNSFCI